ncbi:MAG: hypothetical protein QXQ16_00780 [Candidatus Aenigmatarchaeota archaeon]
MKTWGGPCPNCNSNETEINYIEYNLPNVGNILIYSFLCKKCNFRYSDIIPQSINFNEYEITINGAEDFNKKIYRIPGFKIILEEVEIEIINVSQSKYLIYTVDGFLQEVIDFLKTLEKENDIIKEKISYLKEVLEGKKKLRIIIKKITS